MKDVRSINGQIFVCTFCEKIHLEFGHFSIDFTSQSRLEKFLSYLDEINGKLIEQKSASTSYQRKISVPMAGLGLKLQLSNMELLELKGLVRAFLQQKSTGKIALSGFEEVCNYVGIPCLN